MKIKVQELPYEEVMKRVETKRVLPKRPNPFLKKLVEVLARGDLKATNFTYTMNGMEKLGKSEPCLILMNHSSFIDLKIVSRIFNKRPYNIICTSDGFVGKGGLMRALGCIPTQKFTTDVALVKDMSYALKKLKSSVLMYPEASYSFDGTATPLPDSVGKCIKLLKVPVVVIRTHGAFLRDPLYNNLQLRNVNVSAEVNYVLSPSDIDGMKPSEIMDVINDYFSFDNFREQIENDIRITEDFRADYLNRVCFKCPSCRTEGKMEGKGTKLTCHSCGKVWELTEKGDLSADDGDSIFTHIPDWYGWEREEVRKELLENSYSLDIPVDICMMVNKKSIYRVGEGRLTHSKEGFHLTGCDGKLDYTQTPKQSYSLYSDYFWYELGDMICIGNQTTLYYCFPKEKGDFVAKTRLATEELYKLCK